MSYGPQHITSQILSDLEEIIQTSVSDLEEIVKRAGDQVALLDLGDPQDSRVEGRQRAFAGVGQAHLDKGHMVTSKADRIEQSAVAADDPGLLQPLQPRLCGRFRKADAAGQFRDGDSSVDGHNVENLAVETIQIGKAFGHD